MLHQSKQCEWNVHIHTLDTVTCIIKVTRNEALTLDQTTISRMVQIEGISRRIFKCIQDDNNSLKPFPYDKF